MKILVAYDGSECADAALEDLKRAGLNAEAEVLVMSLADVFVPPPVDEEVDNTFSMYVPDGVRRAHERAQHKLEQAEAWQNGRVNKSSQSFQSGMLGTKHKLIHQPGRSYELPITGSPISSLWERVVIPFLVED